MAAAQKRTIKTIIIVSDTIYPYFKGGKEKRIHEISTRLAALGYDVHIYTMKWWDGPGRIIEDGVHLHGISKLHKVYKNDGVRSIKASLMFAASCFRLLWVKFDVIDVDHMPYFPLFSVWIVCKIKRKKMFATWHEVWSRKYWHEYMGTFGMIGYFIERLGELLPYKIITNSAHTKNRLTERHPSKKNRMITAYNGIDMNEIRSVRPSRQHYDVMYAGRLLKHKNVGMILKAILDLKVEMPKIKCAIVGDGPDKKKLHSYVRRHNLTKNVDFIGFVPKHQQVYSIMKSSRLFVLPSQREGFGMVVIEANACGTPVLTYDHHDNAAKELIQDGVNGYLFRSQNDLASKMRHTLNEWDLTKLKFSKTANKYNWHSSVNTLIDAYTL